MIINLGYVKHLMFQRLYSLSQHCKAMHSVMSDVYFEERV